MTLGSLDDEVIFKKAFTMEKLSHLHSEILDIINRIERLDEIEELHQSQPIPDTLALEGYQRLRQQYLEQLEQLARESGRTKAVSSITRKAILMGLDDELIAQLTELPILAIQQLRQENS